MFLKEMQHVLLTWSAGLTKLTTFLRVLKLLGHCDFRKMEVLKGYGCKELLFFNIYPNVQLVKRDIVTAVI